MLEGLSNRFKKEYEKLKSEIKKPNILVLGATGAGKSALINRCFGKEVVESKAGKPVTKHVARIESDDFSCVLYDAQGYEVGVEKQKEFLEEVVAFAKQLQDKPIEEQVHVVWYFLQASTHRILDIDRDLLKSIHGIMIPIAAVLSKCDAVTVDELKNLESEVKNIDPGIPSFRTTSRDIKELDYLDLNKLIEWSVDELPSGMKLAFVKAQKTNLDLKWKQAHNAVLQHSGGSAFVGFVPLPLADAPLLLANQSAMLVRVMYIYDMEQIQASIEPIIGSVIGLILPELGVWIVGQIAKLIPGIGTLIGGFINASVAATLTYAVGMAVSDICYRINEYVLVDDYEGLDDYMSSLSKILEELIKEYIKKGRPKND